MAIYSMGPNKIEGVGDLGCDATADVANLPTYADSNRLKEGTTCLCAETSDVYYMKSDRTWKKL